MGSGKARELVHDTSLGTWGIPVIVKELRKTYNIQYFLEDEHDKTLLELLCPIALGNIQCLAFIIGDGYTDGCIWLLLYTSSRHGSKDDTS